MSMMEATRGVKQKGTIRATFVFFGTIIGAGIFGLPSMVAKSGYPVGLFWMLLLAVAVTLTHLLFGEVVLATPGEHRIIGYVGMHLGKGARRIEEVASILSLFGSSLAYLILGGLFIPQILSRFVRVTPTVGSAFLLLFGIAAVWGGTKFLSGVDFWLTLVEMSSFLLLAGIGFTALRGENLATVHLSESFLPYGVVLFAYGGLAAVTEVKGIVGGQAGPLRRSIAWGTFLATALTILFVTSVVGALGEGTTAESVAGLNARFGGAVPMIGAIAGFFSILTSYIVFSEYLKREFQLDFKMKPVLASAAAVGVPFLLFLAGVRSFGRILELVGAVLVAVEGIFVCLMFLNVRRSKPEAVLNIPGGIVYLLIAIYAAGTLYELIFRLLMGR